MIATNPNTLPADIHERISYSRAPKELLSRTGSRFPDTDQRDVPQSTVAAGNRVSDPRVAARMTGSALMAGIFQAERTGGQHPLALVGQGRNPFTTVNTVGHINRIAGGPIDTKMLVRGTNLVRLTPCEPDMVRETLKEFLSAGVSVFRFFHALNDPDQFYIPPSLLEARKEGIKLQGALSFTTYNELNTDELGNKQKWKPWSNWMAREDLYTDKYYVGVAKALIRKGFNAIAIKDMCGQLKPERLEAFIEKLREELKGFAQKDGSFVLAEDATAEQRRGEPKVIPLELHMHATHSESPITFRKAVDLGLDIDTGNGPLGGGCGHNPVLTANGDGTKRVEVTEGYKDYLRVLREEQGHLKNGRLDLQFTQESRDKLCDAGVPGGAMPVYFAKIKEHIDWIVKRNPKAFAALLEEKRINLREAKWADKVTSSANVNDFVNKAVSVFIPELRRVCADAGFPPLVTPTADICMMQTLSNLWSIPPEKETEKAKGLLGLRDRYCNPGQILDARFLKLVLGHYGKNQSQEGNQIDGEKLEFFEGLEAPVKGEGMQKFQRTTESYESRIAAGAEELPEHRAKAERLIGKFGYKALAYASRNQMAILAGITNSKPPEHLEESIQKHISRVEAEAEKFRPEGLKMRFIPDFGHMILPLIHQIEAMIQFGLEIKVDPMDLRLEDFGAEAERIFEAYKEIPYVKAISQTKASEVVATESEQFKKLGLSDLARSLYEALYLYEAQAPSELDDARKAREAIARAREESYLIMSKVKPLIDAQIEASRTKAPPRDIEIGRPSAGGPPDNGSGQKLQITGPHTQSSTISNPAAGEAELENSESLITTGHHPMFGRIGYSEANEQAVVPQGKAKEAP